MLSAQRQTKNDETPFKSSTTTAASPTDEICNVNTNARESGNTYNDSENLRLTMRTIMQEELHVIVREAIREEFSSLRKEMRSFEDSLSYMNAKFEDMKTKVEAYMQDTKQLRTESELLQRKVKDLESRLSVMEQDSRQNNIEIHCLPEHKHENLINAMMQIGKVIGFTLSETDVLSCNRVQKQNNTSNLPKKLYVDLLIR
ncbi:unnamed protein product [Parnassius apollo]|uniref:(apollo) hypothetical protein n=1 Tax=Parnassius apollo TaxID=110799 RepID=A0A8S3W672_PARAO|nr:unnamed protein product [Parnassius apollo]